jgi:hypothetical protein
MEMQAVMDAQTKAIEDINFGPRMLAVLSPEDCKVALAEYFESPVAVTLESVLTRHADRHDIINRRLLLKQAHH